MVHGKGCFFNLHGSVEVDGNRHANQRLPSTVPGENLWHFLVEPEPRKKPILTFHEILVVIRDPYKGLL